MDLTVDGQLLANTIRWDIESPRRNLSQVTIVNISSRMDQPLEDLYEFLLVELLFRL